MAGEVGFVASAAGWVWRVIKGAAMFVIFLPKKRMNELEAVAQTAKDDAQAAQAAAGAADEARKRAEAREQACYAQKTAEEHRASEAMQALELYKHHIHAAEDALPWSRKLGFSILGYIVKFNEQDIAFTIEITNTTTRRIEIDRLYFTIETLTGAKLDNKETHTVGRIDAWSQKTLVIAMGGVLTDDRWRAFLTSDAVRNGAKAPLKVWINGMKLHGNTEHIDYRDGAKVQPVFLPGIEITWGTR